MTASDPGPAGKERLFAIIVHGDHGSRITIHDPVFENAKQLSPMVD